MKNQYQIILKIFFKKSWSWGRLSKMVDCQHPYIPAATKYPEEGRSGTPKGTCRVPQPVRNKALSESTNREATNHRRIGIITHSSTLLTPRPWSLCELQAPILGTWWKVLFLGTHRNSEIHTPLYYTTCYFHPKMPGELAPLHKQDPGFLRLHE
jgi:hypothetical protein